jgi:hypothetical protein
LLKTIEEILEENDVKDKINIVNPAPAVALQTKRVLENLDTTKENSSQNYFYST